MKEESLHEDLKYFVTKPLSDLPEFMRSSSQSWARAHLVSPHAPHWVHRYHLSVPTPLPASPQPECGLGRRPQEQAGSQEPNPFPGHSNSNSRSTFCLPLSGASGGEREDLEVYPEDTGLSGARKSLPFISRPWQVCLQNVQTQMNDCLSTDAFLILPGTSLPENM